MSYFGVILLMLSAGLVGGTVNHMLLKTDKSTWKDWMSSIILGIGASFLIPLFLNTISSSLLSGILNDTDTTRKADIFVFGGFCLLGAISSKAMIQTLTQRVLKETEENREKLKAIEETIAPIVVKETEPELETDPTPKIESSGGIGFKLEAFGTSGNGQEIIKSLGNSNYSRRTVDGIRKEIGVSLNEVLEMLKWLETNDLAMTSGNEGHYWSLTEKGRKAFRHLLAVPIKS